MASEGADEDGQSGPAQDQDRLEEEISKQHEKLFSQFQAGHLDWIPLTLNTTTKGSSNNPTANKTKFDQFKTQYESSFWGGINDNTIIHTLVDWKDAEKQKYKPLLQLVLQIDPDLLDIRNYDEQKPLHKAILSRKPSDVVQLLCEIAPSPSALIKDMYHQDNCLHLAIKHGLASEPAIDVLIESGGDALKGGDGDGNTPLHLAVDHKHFVGLDSQLSLVKKLVEKCPDALEEQNNGEEGERGEKGEKGERKNKRAPFLYLQESRKKFEESRSTETESIALRREANSHSHESNTKAASRPAKSGQRGNRKGKSAAVPDDQVKLIFESIEMFLKRFILRNFSHNKALEMLYGPVSGDHAIDFNLLTSNRRLSPKMIKENYRFLKFENILQYVALPNLLPIAQPPSRTTSEGEQKPESKGLQEQKHYQEIFKWLKTKGGVEEILRIIIEDDLDNPHGDKVIIDTIKDLAVEIWDWKKYDICSETIRKAAPNVKEVYLYTTGNNAVLRGWSDQSGLIMLKKLEKIVLFVKGVQSRQGINDDIEQFTTRLETLIEQDNKEMYVKRVDLEQLIERSPGAMIRLDDVQELAEPIEVKMPNKRRINIEVTFEDSPDETRVTQIPKRLTWDQQKAHRWLDCADRCASWVRNSNIENLKPVKIALIDDGVDASHLHLRDNIKEGVTYCTSCLGKSNVPSSYYGSSNGHGTLMAALISYVCRDAHLYVAKLDDQHVTDGSTFTARSAAEAVKWAVGKQVDIISMSWTIEDSWKTTEKMEALSDLDDALEEAAKQNILMFCAARDAGLENPKQVPFPAKSRTKNIMVIGAAGPSGAISTWVNAESVHFLFPGIELRNARLELMPPEMEEVDGSSTATALASGLAGLLLTILSTDTSKTWVSKVGIHEKIKNILNSIKGDTNYVQVWDLFHDYTQDPGSEGDLRTLQKMVEWILSKAK